MINIGQFKKGMIPWNKGKKQWKDRKHPNIGIHWSNIIKDKMRKAKLGIK